MTRGRRLRHREGPPGAESITKQHLRTSIAEGDVNENSELGMLQNLFKKKKKLEKEKETPPCQVFFLFPAHKI